MTKVNFSKINVSKTLILGLTLFCLNVYSQEQSVFVDVDSSDKLNNENVGSTDQTENIDKSEMLNHSQVNSQDVFKQGYALFKNEKWQDASDYLFRFLQVTSVDDKNYEWAEFFMGICLEKLGFTHAAMDRLANLAARKPNIRIMAYTLEMFENISRNEPFDYEQIILQIVNDQDFDFISSDISGFVHFNQGIQDAKTQHEDWAQDHFSKIPKDTYYYHRFLHYDALREYQLGNKNEAIEKLKNILLLTNIDNKLADDSRWALARIYYELNKWQLATDVYLQITKPVVEQASFLLERAWISYQQKDYERAMGFLYAFEAPSFKQFFTPEYYILKSFIYKDVCHFESALSISDEFSQRYGKSLAAIYDRKQASDVQSEELLYVILAKQDVKDRWDFIQVLESEKQRISDIDYEALAQHINSVYNLKISKSSKIMTDLINDEFKVRANLLLEFEESANLMRYEIGVDMYQSVAKARFESDADLLKKAENNARSNVMYSFQGEYWNDELGHYQVRLLNKCKSFEDWELFF